MTMTIMFYSWNVLLLLIQFLISLYSFFDWSFDRSFFIFIFSLTFISSLFALCQLFPQVTPHLPNLRFFSHLTLSPKAFFIFLFLFYFRSLHLLPSNCDPFIFLFLHLLSSYTSFLPIPPSSHTGGLSQIPWSCISSSHLSYQYLYI